MSGDNRAWLQLGMAVIGAGFVIGSVVTAAATSMLVYMRWACCDEVDLSD